MSHVTAARISEMNNVRQINLALQEELLDKLDNEEAKMSDLDHELIQTQNKYNTKCKEVEFLRENEQKRQSQIKELTKSLNISSKQSTKFWTQLQMITKSVQQKSDQIEAIIASNKNPKNQSDRILNILAALNNETNNHRISVSVDINRLNRQRRESQKMVTEIEHSLILHRDRWLSLASDNADLSSNNSLSPQMPPPNELPQSQTFHAKVYENGSKQSEYATCYGTHLTQSQSLPSRSTLRASLPSNSVLVTASSYDKLQKTFIKKRQSRSNDVTMSPLNKVLKQSSLPMPPKHSLSVPSGTKQSRSLSTFSVQSSDNKTVDFTVSNDEQSLESLSLIVNPATSSCPSCVSSGDEIDGLRLVIADLENKTKKNDQQRNELQATKIKLKRLNDCQMKVINSVLHSFGNFNSEFRVAVERELKQFSAFLCVEELMFTQAVNKLSAIGQNDYFKALYEEQLELNGVIAANETKLNERYEEEKEYAKKLRIKLDETLQLLKKLKQQWNKTSFVQRRKSIVVKEASNSLIVSYVEMVNGIKADFNDFLLFLKSAASFEENEFKLKKTEIMASEIVRSRSESAISSANEAESFSVSVKNQL